MKVKQSVSILVVILLVSSALTPVVNAFYHPQPGRWLNRDPASEAGGYNLGAFLRNAPIGNVDSIGLVALVTVGNTPAISPNGTYAFGAVWFTFSTQDFYALGGEGTLVWSRTQCFDIRPCNTIYGGFQACRSMWFRKSFTIDINGALTGGDLWNQNTDGIASGTGLGLEVSGQSVAALLQSVGASSQVIQGVSACGSHGWLTADVNWAVVGGALAGGSTAPQDNFGFDRTTPHTESPPESWTDWSGAVASGTLSMRADWDQCVNPATRSLHAWSSMQVGDGGPNIDNKRPQDGQHVSWEVR